MNKRIKKKHKKLARTNLGRLTYKEYREVLRSFKKALRSGNRIKILEWALSYGVLKPSPHCSPSPECIQFTLNGFPENPIIDKKVEVFKK